MPTPIDELSHKIMQLEIEEQSLTKKRMTLPKNDWLRSRP